ncbi:adenylate/guanylate cyclase domain-containing protein [Bradyrhizobium sp. SZCCHNS2096]|uniref:adenylate/guanylate cyclase domain-containing protein n=1 Tax=Bradyrhizobium sp. SZCCHNS2096 TaxID=3057309 RepID=UPI0029161F72|nr:AAA family ATPase [Bradyrhizobium sp. SZCCHNS2096]
MPKQELSSGRGEGLARWLEDFGLGQYHDLFVLHRIDLDVIPDLNEANFAELGIPLGDRKRLQRAAASLRAAAPETQENSKSAAPRTTVLAERRQLTVMFCDMVDSTSLSEQFDPEDVREIIASFRETCVRVVRCYEGFAARYVGDGILVYFGYPNAHEDDAERAVRAGLEIVRTLSMARDDKPAGKPSHTPAVRIGIATGLAVVGDLIGQSTEERDSAVGETLNLAARLQGLAPANGLVIAQSTQSLLKGKFDYQDLGMHALKGITEKIQAWRVVRPSRVETRFAAMGPRLTRLVNRDEELTVLMSRWLQAKEGKGQVVLLSGDPGIGKSRIVQEIRERVAGEPHGHVSFQCSPYYVSTPFHPFVEQLKFALGLDYDSPGAPSLSGLEATVAAAKGDAERVAPLFAALLSIPTADRYARLDLSPQQQKDAMVVALVNHLIGLASDRPLLVGFEDVHWIDPSSLEVLDLLVEKVQNAGILLVITCRPEFQPSWKADHHMAMLTLSRLNRELRTTLVERVAGRTELPREVIEEIIVKTDGVPLFLEELTKAVIESNMLTEKQGRYVFAGPWRQLAIPATLTDSLMARIDRTGPFKKIAQVGATIGREFSYKILNAVADATPDHIEAALDHLEEAGLIVCRGYPPEAAYTFKHVMIQNAAHASLLHSDRRKLHARIAQVLASQYPDKAEREPELLAYHLTESGQSEPAAGFWLKAGRQAAQTGANLEAIGHLRRGLGVVQGNPHMPRCDEMELELRLALGTALIAAKGYAVQEVEENFARALELGQRLDDEAKVFAAMRGLWVCHFIRADLKKAHDLSVELLKFAKRDRANQTQQVAHHRKEYLIEAHRAIAMTMLYRGRFTASHHHLQRCINLYGSDLYDDLRERHGIDSGVVSLSYLGYLLWFLGHPDMAREYSERAISIAGTLRHPFTLAFACEFGAYLCQHLRDVEGTMRHAERAFAISSEHGFLHYKYQASILKGWAAAELGDIDDGLKQLQAGLDAYEGTDSWLASSWFRSMLACAYVRAGMPDAALRALDGALAMAKRTGDHFLLAEIYRLQGDITLMQGGLTAAPDAEELFRQSLDIAREQSALSWELRSSVSLARLLRDTGRQQQAAELILPVCRKFTEGFETPDMKDAIQLMDELGLDSKDQPWSEPTD